MKSIQAPSNLKKSYIVCSTGRSGSTLLCRTLEKLDCCGKPEEFFHDRFFKSIKDSQNLDNFVDYCNSIFEIGSTDNGVFGAKMHWWQLIDFLKMARQLPYFQGKQDVEILNAVFPHLQFIYIWREDTSKQAISTIIALQTKQWDKKDLPESENDSQIDRRDSTQFQPLQIYRWEKSFEDQNRRWREFFQNNSLDRYAISYEGLIQSFDREITQIIDYLGLSDDLAADRITMPIHKQANEINREFLQRYQQIPKLALKVVYKLKNMVLK